MVFWRLRNLRCFCRLVRWKWMVRRIPPDHLCFNVQGLRLYLSPHDVGLSPELAVERVHEPILTATLRTLLRPNMTVVDVGANLGYFALLAARAVGPSGKVLALEPFPESYRLLKKNIQANGLQNVLPYAFAAGHRSGPDKLYFYPQSNWNSLFLKNDKRKPLGWIEVQVCTLNELLATEPRVDVIRMDVEGAELAVLKGSDRILKKHRPTLIIETHPTLMGEDQYAEFLHFLKQMGYSIEEAWERWREEPVWPRRLSTYYKAGREVRKLDVDYLLALESAVTIIANCRGSESPE
ncbi:MAG: FkbM family methyltransferase [Armatimonadota bacterium]|nr:FkbM family methyltransferase [Armatimonadota bacterium]